MLNKKQLVRYFIEGANPHRQQRRFDFSIRAARATGTIRMAATLSDERELDPNGDIRCNSGRVSWTAKKR